MIPERLPAAIHASAAAWVGRGILLLGEPGSGKSTLLAELLAAGAYLVADDLVRLEMRDRVVCATSGGATGLIELRGNGIFRVATTDVVPVNLCVELTPAPERDRLPEGGMLRVAGTELPLLRAWRNGRFPVAQVLLALCARRVA